MLRLAHYYGDFFTVPVMILGAAAYAGISALSVASGFAGLGAWTLFEYLIHRLLHDGLGRPRDSHLAHHQAPAAIEVERSSLSTLLIAAIVAIILVSGLGATVGGGALAGLLTGYLSFIVVHHAVHRRTIYPTSLLHAARRRHSLHHYRGPGNYGVVTSFWDVVFSTRIT